MLDNIEKDKSKNDYEIVLQKHINAINNSSDKKRSIFNIIKYTDTKLKQEKYSNSEDIKKQCELFISDLFKEFIDVIDEDIVNYYYWKTDLNANILKKRNNDNQLLIKLKINDVKVKCDKCNNIYIKHFKNKRDYNYQKLHSNRLCDNCLKEIQELKIMPYKEYLQTEHWEQVRKQALFRAKYKCQLCGNSKDALHVHHNTYENRGEEKPEDLIVLCKSCHEKFHDKSSRVEEESNIDLVKETNGFTQTKLFLFNIGEVGIDKNINEFVIRNKITNIIDIKTNIGNDVYSALLMYT